jgi:hypothetical protein
LTRVITIIALTCFLVAGAAATSILGRDSLPDVRLPMVSAVFNNNPTPEGPVSNKAGKQDRLEVARFALAAFEPQREATGLSDQLRQAYAASSPADVAPGITFPSAIPQAPLAAPKPKVANKPLPQKSYALLSDIQIAGIKERLKLSSAQESYWPAVETALRAIARKIHATRQTNPSAVGAPIDPEAEEVQQLKSAAMPLLFQLREDQKREVRALARIIGLEKVAAQI